MVIQALRMWMTTAPYLSVTLCKDNTRYQVHRGACHREIEPACGVAKEVKLRDVMGRKRTLRNVGVCS